MFGFLWELLTLPFRLVVGLIGGIFGMITGLIGGAIGLVFGILGAILGLAVPVLIIFFIVWIVRRLII